MAFGGAAGQISALQIARLSRSGLRMSVPVKPSQTVFAQYRHISGVPASTGQRTVPLSKVQLLNSLIDNLQRLKNDPSYASAAAQTSPERTDALIEQYASELHQVIKSVPAAFGAMGSASGAGMIFALTA
jgi:hypothetical protein